MHTRHSSRIQMVTVAMITSKIEGLKLEGDVLLKDWKKSALLHPSLVRLCKMATIDAQLIDKPLGDGLHSEDLKKIKTQFKKMFQTWI